MKNTSNSLTHVPVCTYIFLKKCKSDLNIWCVSANISKTGFYKKYYTLNKEKGVSYDYNEWSDIILIVIFFGAILILK